MTAISRFSASSETCDDIGAQTCVHDIRESVHRKLNKEQWFQTRCHNPQRLFKWTRPIKSSLGASAIYSETTVSFLAEVD